MLIFISSLFFLSCPTTVGCHLIEKAGNDSTLKTMSLTVGSKFLGAPQSLEGGILIEPEPKESPASLLGRDATPQIGLRPSPFPFLPKALLELQSDIQHSGGEPQCKGLGAREFSQPVKENQSPFL